MCSLYIMQETDLTERERERIWLFKLVLSCYLGLIQVSVKRRQNIYIGNSIKVSGRM